MTLTMSNETRRTVATGAAGGLIFISVGIALKMYPLSD